MDHRRVIADRNRTAILDAAERLFTQGSAVTMAAVAAQAGVSRPTLYAHFNTLPELVEAAVTRLVDATMHAIDAAEPERGPAPAALGRMLEASWSHLAAFEAITRGAVMHLPADHVQRTHAPLIERTMALLERGQADGSFRTDLPAPWLVQAYYALIHAADQLARETGIKRADVLSMLKTSVHSLVAAAATGTR